MKKLFRRNQIIVTALAVMIAIAGYLNYADSNINKKLDADAANEVVNGDSDDINEDSDQILSNDDLLTSGKDIESQDGEETTTGSEETTAADQAGNEDETETKAANSDQANADGETVNPGEAVLVSGIGNSNFAATAKLNREQARAKSKETLQSIIDNSNISEAAKVEAINKMVELTDITSRESAAETLLAAKGFENAVVTITDGKVDVAVIAEKISDSQRAQIEDVVKRKTNIAVKNIYIIPVSE